jgi:membrane protease YdiL (CAAX protease family)
MEEKQNPLPLSRMSAWETICALCWLPIHIAALPLLLWKLYPGIGSVNLNFATYALGATTLALLCRRFLRRDFDQLCDGFRPVLRQVLLSYLLMIAANMLINRVLYWILPEANPNTEAVVDLVALEPGKSAAMTVLLAPILEELMFRGGIFGLIRRKFRVLAYALSMLLFAAYHVWGYGIANPIYWLFIFQYLPITFLLCRCYEKTETIWCPIFLHMLVNGISLWAQSVLRGLGA